MLWASSKEYEKLVGEQLGWSRVPAGKRAITYEIPEYKKAAAAFGDITLKSIEEADPANPGVQPRPTVGVQFVAHPRVPDLGHQGLPGHRRGDRRERHRGRGARRRARTRPRRSPTKYQGT